MMSTTGKGDAKPPLPQKGSAGGGVRGLLWGCRDLVDQLGQTALLASRFVRVNQPLISSLIELLNGDLQSRLGRIDFGSCCSHAHLLHGRL